MITIEVKGLKKTFTPFTHTESFESEEEAFKWWEKEKQSYNNPDYRDVHIII